MTLELKKSVCVFNSVKTSFFVNHFRCWWCSRSCGLCVEL